MFGRQSFRNLRSARGEIIPMDDPRLKVADVARLLSAHPQSIYKLISARRIPFEKIPGIGLRIDRIILEEWLNAQRIGRGAK